MANASGALRLRESCSNHRSSMLGRFEELRQMHGADHPATRGALLNLANYTFHYKMYAEAAALYGALAESQESALGGDHPATLCMRSIWCLSQAYAGVDAVAAMRDVVDLQIAIMGADNECVEASQRALAVCTRLARCL